MQIGIIRSFPEKQTFLSHALGYLCQCDIYQPKVDYGVET